ncbi:UNVERIFIED_CONTAM: RNA polymerase II mediator complex subunit, partial [Siphonaria sp. JEL0065]
KLNELLAEICKNQPPITRAAWFIRCTILNNPQLCEQKLPAAALGDTFTKYIQSQLDRIGKSAGGSTPPNIPANYKGLQPTNLYIDNFKSPEARNAFISSCIELITYFYFEGLLDHRKVMVCLIDRINFKKVNSAQGNLAIPLVWNLIGEVVKSKTLTRSVLESIVPRTKMIKDLCQDSELLAMQYTNLVNMIQYIAIAEPDSFLSPLWAACEPLRADVFRPAPDSTLKLMPEHSRQLVLKDLANLEIYIDQRVMRMKYHMQKGPERPVSVNVMNIQDTETLNIAELSKRWFEVGTLADRIKDLIKWSLLPVDLGDKVEFERRVYLVNSLLLEFITTDKSGQARGQCQIILMDILNEFVLSQHNEMRDESSDLSEFEKMIWLYGDFIRTCVFSLANFAQRLISRGSFEHPELKGVYMRLFLVLPVFEHGNHIANIRLELREENDKAEESVLEENLLEEAKSVVRALLPEIYPTGHLDDEISIGGGKFLSDFNVLLPTMNDFVKSAFVKWIKTGYEVFVVKSVAINAENWKRQISSLSPGASLLSVHQYMTLIEIFELIADIRSILQLNMWLLTVKADKKLIPYILDTFWKYMVSFRYMGEAHAIATMSWANKQLFVVTSSVLDNRFVCFISSLSGFLSVDQQEAFTRDTQTPKLSAKDLAFEFNEIRNIKDTEDSVASAISNLSFRYGGNPDVVARIFKYSISVLTKFAAENSLESTQKRIQSIVRVLQGINHHGRFLEKHIGDSFIACFDSSLNTGSSPLFDVIGDSWMLHFLVQLMLSYCCTIETLILKLLVPGISYQFTTSKPDQISRFLNVISVLHCLLIYGEFAGDSADGSLSLSKLDIHTLKGIRGSSLQQKELFSALFDCIFKLGTIRDRFESNISSTKPQDVVPLTKSLELVKKTIEFATSTNGWFKVLVETNSAFLRESKVTPWVHLQRELAINSLAPSRSQKKSTTPAAVARKTSKAFVFLRQAFTRPGDLLFDLSVERTALSALIEKMLLGVNESNYQLRKIRLFLMFQEVAILSQLKADGKLMDGHEELVVTLVAEKFLQSLRSCWNYWLYSMIPELPISVLGMVLRKGQDLIEKSLAATSFPNLMAEESTSIENVVEVCCCAANVLVEEVLLLGKSARSEAIEGCLRLFSSVVNQLDWFLKRKEDIAHVESIGIRGSSLPEGSHPVKDLHFLNKLRMSLMTRLRILGTLMPFFINRIELCSPLKVVQILLMLSVCNLVENCEISLGDSVLDYAAYFMEAPESVKHPDLKAASLVQNIQPKLTFRRSLLKRLSRIFPLQFESPYLKNVVSTMDFTKQPYSIPRDLNLIWDPIKHFEPYNWLETRSYSLKSESIAPGSSSARERDGEAAVKDIGKKRLNDTPISLSLFGGTVATQPVSLFEQLKKDGWQQEANVGYEVIKKRSKSLFDAIMRHSNKA